MIGSGEGIKKTSLASFFIVVGLLVLCVTTLVAVYALAPGASVLLLEETFDGLEGGKWRHEVADCEEDDGNFRYVTADEGNRLIADGVLHIYPNITSVRFKTKREARRKCSSCTGSGNSTTNCASSLISAKLESENAFEATRGRVEIRAKICCGEHIHLNIGITQNQNNSLEESFEEFEESGNATARNTSRIRIFFESSSNKTIMKSAIPDNEFHIYEVSWNEERVSLEVDKKKVEEQRLEGRGREEENISNGTVKLDSGPISKPFYLSVGVGFKEKEPENVDTHPNNKRSLDSSTDFNKNIWETSTILEVDYIRIFKILN